MGGTAYKELIVGRAQSSRCDGRKEEESRRERRTIRACEERGHEYEQEEEARQYQTYSHLSDSSRRVLGLAWPSPADGPRWKSATTRVTCHASNNSRSCPLKSDPSQYQFQPRSRLLSAPSQRVSPCISVLPRLMGIQRTRSDRPSQTSRRHGIKKKKARKQYHTLVLATKEDDYWQLSR